MDGIDLNFQTAVGITVVVMVMSREQIYIPVSKQKWMDRGSWECNQVKGTVETNAPTGNERICFWSWCGTELDPFGEVVQEVKDEKHAIQVKVQETIYHQI